LLSFIIYLSFFDIEYKQNTGYVIQYFIQRALHWMACRAGFCSYINPVFLWY